MKHKNLLVTLALCALIQAPLCLGSETQQTRWERYAPITAQNIASAMSQKASSAYTTTRDYAASWVPQSIKDTVNSWSTKKKMAVATAILVALAAVYKRDVLMQWVDNVIKNREKATLEKELNEALNEYKTIKKELDATYHSLSDKDYEALKNAYLEARKKVQTIEKQLAIGPIKMN